MDQSLERAQDVNGSSMYTDKSCRTRVGPEQGRNWHRPLLREDVSPKNKLDEEGEGLNGDRKTAVDPLMVPVPWEVGDSLFCMQYRNNTKSPHAPNFSVSCSIPSWPGNIQ
jgi:hypothetical protein